MEGLWLQLALVAALILLNGAFAGSEIALISLREGQLIRLERQDRRGRTLARLARDPIRFLGTIQIGITLAGFLASATASVALAEPLVGLLSFLGAAGRPGAILMVTLAVTFTTLVLGELAPKRLAMQRAERWGLLIARPLAALSRLAQPVLWLLGQATDLAVRIAGGDPSRRGEEVTEEELRDLVVTQTTFTPDQREIISGAFELADRPLRDVLVPRSTVLAFPADLPAAEALAQLLESGHSRAPVYRIDLDNLVGMVHLRRLIGADGAVEAHTRPVVVLPQSASVLSTLRLLQREREQMAVVINEYGSFEGLVTIEDLLEELVGEIWSEMDKNVRTVIRNPDGSLTLPGTFPVHDLPDIGVDLPEGDYTTIAGLVLERLGYLPRPGEQVVVQGWRLDVLEVADHAITRVRILPHQDQAAP